MRTADHNDAKIILDLYELRREPVMRQARSFWMKFQPKSYSEVKPLLSFDLPENTFFRQVSSYWEMAASFVNRQILHPQLFADNCGEGLFVYAKVEPFLKEIRSHYHPGFMMQMENAVRDHREIGDKLSRIREILKGKSL